MSGWFARCLVGALLAVAAPPAPVALTVDLSGAHDLAAPSADASAALPGTCTLAEYQALPSTDRYVYDFENWPAAQESLGVTACEFRFRLGAGGVTDQTLGFSNAGAFPPTRVLGRRQVGDGHVLVGLGNIGWAATQQHAFRFERPVRAFGLVYRSPAAFVLQRFYWPGCSDNGYALSYTLTDGTVVNLGRRGVASAPLAAGTDTFVGVVDRSGRGIVAVQLYVKGTSKGDQVLTADNLTFVTLPRPAVAPVVSLRASHDFLRAEAVAPAPERALPGLATLAEFRFMAGTHRFVYDFGTWPQVAPDLGSDRATFKFDLQGRGAVGQQVTVAAGASAGPLRLSRATLTNEDGSATPALAGLGDLGGRGWAEQTFTFAQPVTACGAVLRSPAEFSLARGRDVPISYTLADGTVKTVDASTALATDRDIPAGIVGANTRTYVGVQDESGVGIVSLTLREQGGAASPQPLYIESLAFARLGLPPGEWRQVWADEFDGTALDQTKWGTGYRFVDVINHELQGYVPENVVVANGVCTLNVEQRVCRNTDQYGHRGAEQRYASGAITTYDKVAWKYGYFEARVKMTSGPGTWPAFWMLPDRGRAIKKLSDRVTTGDTGYGFGSELDIFEFMPWWQGTDGLFLSHSGCIWSYGPVTAKDPAPHSYGGYALDNHGYGPALLRYPRADTQFHTYGLYWGPGRLIFYLDSKPVMYIDDDKHVPSVPEYILLNVALSGNGWGQGPHKRDPSLAEIAAGMPSRMEIDYVRVYEGTPEL